MHTSAFRCGQVFFAAYGKPGARILDIGALDINGSLRSVAPEGAEFVGIDLEAGPSVDVVIAPNERFPFEDDSFDLVVSTSCFEHDQFFWQTMLEAMRVLRPGGYFYFNAPSNGEYHSYPHDNWRFYPDSGMALANWALANGVAATLVESGILPQEAGDSWSDYFVVICKSSDPPQLPRGIADAFPGATNVRRAGREEVGRLVSRTEDQRRIDLLTGKLVRAKSGWRDAKVRLKGLRSSRSWRLTRPLRAIGTIIRGRKR